MANTKRFKELIDWRIFNNIDYNISVSFENINALNNNLNAFCEIYKDDVLKNASLIKTKKTHGSLAGLIVGIKDLFCYKNHVVQAGSKILNNFESIFSATIVERILNSDGLIIGRQNCDEFGMGASNENSIYGPVHNYLDEQKTSGGSSGGSAVAVQTDMCHVSLGTDTGGSIRQPASFCGIIGFKPSYGQISRHGVIAHSSSFDTVGILSKNIEDIIDVYDVISGEDDFDYSMDYCKIIPTKKDKFKIAFLDDILNLSCLQKEIKTSMIDFLKKLKDKKHVVDGIKCDFLKQTVPVYYVLTTAEASSNLARYDGVRYGLRSQKDNNFEEMIVNTRSEGFGFEVKKRIMFGNHVFASEKENHFFEKAQLLRVEIKKKMKIIFEKYDFIVLPTTSTTAFKINNEDEDKDKETSFWSDVFTFIASIAQVPAISIPFGFDNNGMPIGIQIIGKRFDDLNLLSFSKDILQK